VGRRAPDTAPRLLRGGRLEPGGQRLARRRPERIEHGAVHPHARVLRRRAEGRERKPEPEQEASEASEPRHRLRASEVNDPVAGPYAMTRGHTNPRRLSHPRTAAIPLATTSRSFG